MFRIQSRIILIIFLFLAACQSNGTTRDDPAPLPTLVAPVTAPSQMVASQMDPSATGASQTPTIIMTPTPLVTGTPSDTPTASRTASPTRTPTITRTPRPTATPTASLTPTRPPPDLPEEFTFGVSHEGRELRGYRVGDGGAVVMLVGGIHGGFEANTVTLAEDLLDHFQNTPDDVLPGISLVIIPVLNPDGLAAGNSLEGRFNAEAVDLNRNWDCGWEPVAFFREDEVDPGSRPFSEPETRALSALIRDVEPLVVLFYHSAAGGVFEGNCGGADSLSAEMAVVLGEATGYSYGEEFSAYDVSGTGPGWVDSLGIASADVELFSPTIPEYTRNLRGVMAIQCWLLGHNADAFAVCDASP